ncbi:MAG: cytochrome b/b6 domain-containing protein [Candidatus Thiodiazotropha sp. (ex Notomyrtea botanica)]|nr:cytochrome b/b6 domain-containing protein [Candidatus Thiodiazotropha sp. (ex Notomyrtea botanica)]
MQANTVTRVLVWSRWLRLSHWLLTLCTIGLIATGWLMSIDTGLSHLVSDLHYLLGGLLLPALLLRLYLLFFGSGTDLLSDCEPNVHRLLQSWQVIRFYLTLGKAPLPKWYSHNPLWGPIYLILFFFLVLVAISGLLLLNDVVVFGGISTLDLHQLSHIIILTFSILHIPAVFAHDLSGKAGDISGMVNGYRQFELTEAEQHKNTAEQSVPLNNLIKTLKKQ